MDFDGRYRPVLLRLLCFLNSYCTAPTIVQCPGLGLFLVAVRDQGFTLVHETSLCRIKNRSFRYHSFDFSSRSVMFRYFILDCGIRSITFFGGNFPFRYHFLDGFRALLSTVHSHHYPPNQILQKLTKDNSRMA